MEVRNMYVPCGVVDLLIRFDLVEVFFGVHFVSYFIVI